MEAVSTPAYDITKNSPLPPPNEHMHQLDWFIGEWNVTSRMKTPEGLWVEELVRAIHSWEMGGNLIFEHFFGPLSLTPFEGWSLRKYNPNSGKWEQRWVDSTPGGFANWTGTYADGQFTGYANRFIDDEGKLTGDKAVREIFDKITENGFAWRLESTDDGGATWTVTWTLDYARDRK